jgi:uncharacterized OB-fold protein
MTDAKTYSESDGTFREGKQSDRPCRKCGLLSVTVREWESVCGGYLDYKFECRACGYVWWIDGPDA